MTLSAVETPHGTLCVLLYFKSWKVQDKLWGKELFMGSLNQIAHFSKFSWPDPRERLRSVSSPKLADCGKAKVHRAEGDTEFQHTCLQDQGFLCLCAQT